MTKRNQSFEAFSAGYLFPEIRRRVEAFVKEHEKVELISLGIGDTTHPLTPHVVKGLEEAAHRMGDRGGYSGYGHERGEKGLRTKISERIYHGKIHPDEIYISDGCKCDLGRWQALFGGEVSIAVQDPAYPVYVDGSLLHGVKKIHYLPCDKENHFFPQLNGMPHVDLIYFCSPNNPTGAVATHAMLEELVEVAKQQHAILLFDAAYAEFIQDPTLPKSIYEIPGARSVAIELNSFSKLAGFTGMRLGWSVVPHELKYECGASVAKDWDRVISTIFNGASNIIQRGGEAVLDEKGWTETKQVISYYLNNAALLKRCFEKEGLKVYGGVNAPYLWVHFPGRKSWDVFEEFLKRYQLITTPGAGFGPAGEEYIRISAFNHLSEIEKAVQRIS
ncbi:MAG: LL-diaminopimelate aminotransferase [Simkaniaceae bacterium]|nr:LL-diaminopimelate aminotransferase [Simkaniaceae bacterium]